MMAARRRPPQEALAPPFVTQSAILRNRSALRITETELSVMATLAIIGLSRSPKNG